MPFAIGGKVLFPSVTEELKSRYAAGRCGLRARAWRNGRRARLRIWFRKDWRFKSSRAHQPRSHCTSNRKYICDPVGLLVGESRGRPFPLRSNLQGADPKGRQGEFEGRLSRSVSCCDQLSELLAVELDQFHLRYRPRVSDSSRAGIRRGVKESN